MTTKKGQHIMDEVLKYLDRNPDGLKIGAIQKLVDVSRNSIYRYLEMLELQGLIYKTEELTWKLKEPIKPQTIPGYQYQAILQGLSNIGGSEWDIKTDKGRKRYKELGRFISPYMKIPQVDLEALKARAHHSKEITLYATKVLQEARTVEQFSMSLRFTDDGFPYPQTKLGSIITFEGGYIASDPVVGNVYAHYYILAGMFEAFAQRVIPPIYGGRPVVEILKIDEARQIVDLGLYIFFDKDNPFIDPKTGIKKVLH